MEPCLIGLETKSNCHENWYSRKPGFVLLTTLTETEIELVALRSQTKITSEDISSKSICLHHYACYLRKFSSHVSKKCCNLFGIHKGQKPKGSREITLELAKAVTLHFPNIIPGYKLCISCWRKVKAKQEELISTSESEQSAAAGSDWELLAPRPMSKEKVNLTLQMVGESPISMHSKPMHQRQSLVKRKLSAVAQNLNESFSKIAKTQQLDISVEERPCSSSDATSTQDLIQLMNELKSKFQTANSHADKVQILTCKPASWTIEKTAQFFQCKVYTVRHALSLKAEHGVLAKPTRSSRKGIGENVASFVQNFYQDDEFSRLLPGSKDVVSVGFKVHEQKRLLLCNLKELFIEFKNLHPDVKISFSKFCSLRPKWCVLLGSSGSHAVCVCALHQNAKLLAAACQIDYKELMQLIVCDTTNKDCMVHRCSDCPGKGALISKLQQLECLVETSEVKFRQWQSTDRTTLDTLTLPTDEFIELVGSKLDKLTTHSFIAKSQAQYLKHRKESIEFDTAIVLGDFSENYSFVVQDEVQGYHWNKDQCTLHPVVVYVKNQNDNSLKAHCLCFLSADLQHDTGFVYSLQQTLTSYIQEKFPSIKRLEYFSDGCSGQYKNFKNFFNLTHHFQDFNLEASWSFFATSHGKSPCDGVGGMVKRKLAQASLKRPIDNQILSTEDAYTFCKDEITSVTFFLISKEALHNTRAFLQSRYAAASTVPGTRSFHHFESDSTGLLKFKRISDDLSFCGNHNFLCADTSFNVPVVSLMSYVCCMYDSHWWVGLVVEVDSTANDLQINFLHPCGPSRYFYWPAREDICWVSMSHVLCQIDQPKLASAAATMRHASLKYVLLESDQKHIKMCYEKFLHQ